MMAQFSKASFDEQLRRAMAKIEKGAEKQIGDIATTLWGYINVDAAIGQGQFGSPVLTGRFAASHRVALNGVDSSVAPKNPAGSKRPYRFQGFSPIARVLSSFKLGDTITISNSLDYARKLEGLEDPSDMSPKAPYGIYGVAVSAVKAKFKGKMKGVRIDTL